MKYVIGIDLGTSAVKVLLVSQLGEVVKEVTKTYKLIQPQSGYSEQNPLDWVEQTVAGIREIVQGFNGQPSDIEGISFSGQMHGLVLLDKNNDVLRNAILWNDTRTTKQCLEINEMVGEERLLHITKNPALEGFTLPKLLWVKEHEPELFKHATTFVLPKDYVRYKLTGKLHTDFSDAAGTLLFNVGKKEWSKEICQLVGINPEICPPLIASHEEVGFITSALAKTTGLLETTKVFAGGADNACGAIGAGILEDGKTLCSIGTSGVVLTYESSANKDFGGKVHYFNHSAPNAYYTMGVTLSAGHSLTWFKETFAKSESFNELLDGIETVPAGSNGLLFTPYLMGERTPHANSVIRASFIGIDGSHRRPDLVRSILEGITFSLNESISIFRESGKTIESIVSIGGGAKNPVWLQIQADIFNAKVIKLSSEQGPGMGAAMLAAYGCGWFKDLKECSDVFLKEDQVFIPKKENVEKYKKLFNVYKDVYENTLYLNEELATFRS